MARSRPPSLWLGISLYCLLCPDLVFHLVPGWLPLLYLLVHLQERDSQGCKFLAIWRCFTCLYVYINIIWSFLFCNDSSIGYVIIISWTICPNGCDAGSVALNVNHTRPPLLASSPSILSSWPSSFHDDYHLDKVEYDQVRWFFYVCD